MKMSGIAVLLPWMAAKPKDVQHYVRFIEESNLRSPAGATTTSSRTCLTSTASADSTLLRWRCLVFQPSVLSLWVRAWQRLQARALADMLEDQLRTHGRQPVVLGIFSGSSLAVLGELLRTFCCCTCGNHQQACASSVNSDAVARHTTAPATDSKRRSALLQSFISCVVQPSTPPQPCLKPDALAGVLAGSVPAPEDWVSAPQCKCTHHLLCSCLSGMWFDSCPVDFTSTAGCRMLEALTQNSSIAAPVAHLVAAGGLLGDLVLLESLDAGRISAWASMAFSPLMTSLPCLFCYSWDDEIADAQRQDNGFPSSVKTA
jgi:hypothetical protein